MAARVHYVNSDGAGFSDQVEIQDGESIESFLRRRGVTSPDNYYIRVNGQPVTAAQVLTGGERIQVTVRPGTVSADRPLNEGDRVSVTPKKVAGADSQ